MNTPTHLLVGAAAFARPGGRAVNAAALAGSAAPDLSLFAMVFWSGVVLGRSPDQIFGEDYYAPFWRSVFAVDNSVFVYGALLLAGLALRAAAAGPPLVAFAGAALLHIGLDLPVHHDDGRPHFWPLTDWVYASPISYWDPQRSGHWVSLGETALFAGLAVLLWRRFGSPAARTVLAIAAAAQLTTQIGWIFALS